MQISVPGRAGEAIPAVDIVVLNWNGGNSLVRCVDSVLSQTYPNIHLRVVDNASTDESIRMLNGIHPDIPVSVNPENLGFAAAHNRVIRESRAAFYMPLNPDVMLSRNYVECMVEAMTAHESAGSIMGKLLFMRDDGTATDIIYSTGHLLTRSRSPSNRGYKQRDVGQFETTEVVFAANGAAPLYRRTMLDDVALPTNGEFFCEDFFIYGEDHDLGWRSLLRGWECWYTPSAIGYHIGFGSGGMSHGRIQAEFTRNRYLTLLRNDALLHVAMDLPFIVLYELILQGSYLLRSPKRLVWHWRGIIDSIGTSRRVYSARKIIQAHRRATPADVRSFVCSKLW